MKIPKLPWARLLAEGALIIVSVYLAIVLEGISRDRESARAAHIALAQMLDEMREDRSDVAEIRAIQIERDGQYKALIRSLTSLDTMPLEPVVDAMDSIFFSNRTLYPRRAAWTTMVAAGQLAELDDPALVTRLGNFYESVTVRVIDSGQDYDENINEIGRNSAPEIWDGLNGRLLTNDIRNLTKFQNQLRYLHIGWNTWYVDRLDDYNQRLGSLIVDIESYLKEHAG